MAVMSKELATINVTADFPYELSEAELGNIYTEEAYAYFKKLQFKNLLSRFDVAVPANQAEAAFKQKIGGDRRIEAILRTFKPDIRQRLLDVKHHEAFCTSRRILQILKEPFCRDPIPCAV